ncbi:MULTISPECIES: ADP-ribosylglycohydrolase family protein [unclassified Coleofasciculus]|uniref:ADP-ribosylglycohydrolase family protein n=1 Tax=unclassified Coleofasciculus TaxID=2692782 RepID=UPI001881D0B2|nr:MULTISPECIES: ADP-ribosylglycohydrolase family protein [unclassified Coleofasciculus]MBE9127646.1 ADP-ribosylglycohydrolase family protein [Coleofasciculus sp. LEGE 07081]MBE9150969.1 ADP-ribosylglycohydrolase family protein [Coleofasciculus sp. LEGE 07092]
MKQTALDLNDAALGCLLGALVGDAAGATLEFMGRQPTLTEVDGAMSMPGGGVWQVAPGQITDDGELTLCLAQALSQSSTFQRETIAQNYAKWVESVPFDMGSTTSHSIGCFRRPKWEEICNQQGYAAGMTQAAAQLCMDSKANGSLMRITPLGIWGYRFSDRELADFAQQDSRLSHPNESCTQAVACYVIAIATLMRRLGDNKTAFERAQYWAESYGNEEVRSWLQDAQNDVDIPFYPHAGFIQIAFSHAFRHLWKGSNYVDAIRETLSGGGDTDTNACIVGGLLGAACGARAIPDEMKLPLLNCDFQQGRQHRPPFLHPNQVSLLVKKLLAVG